MSALAPDAATPSRQTLGEAADWLVCFQAGEPDAATLQAFATWHSQCASHAAAWRHANEVLAIFGDVPSGVVRATVERVNTRRRRLLRGAGGLALTLPATGWVWHQAQAEGWTAQWRTGTGERRELVLADGSTVVLNTRSALDPAPQGQRGLHLRQGELLLRASHQPDVPFLLQAGTHGQLQLQGTELALRVTDTRATVTVLRGEATVQPRQASARVWPAGTQGWFDAQGLDAAPEPARPPAWLHGMLQAHDLPLGELLAELARYRPGLLQCDPAVAGLSVSGAFPVTDTDRSLALLSQTLPVRVVYRTAWWVRVLPLAQA